MRWHTPVHSGVNRPVPTGHTPRRAAPLLIAVTVMLAVKTAVALDVSLTSNNSSVTIDPASVFSVYSWQVDDVEQLTQQSTWYRLEPTDEYENHVSAVPPAILEATQTSLTARYEYARFAITAAYTLEGGPSGSGRARLTESITLANTGADLLELHLFKYVDLDVDGQSEYNQLELIGGSTAIQSGYAGSTITTLATPAATHVEAAFYSTLIDSLSDLSPTTLNDDRGPLEGDVAFAMQWDLALPVGATEQFLLVHEIVPEPSSLMCLVFMALMGVRCRR